MSESNIGGNPEARIDWAFGESQKAGNERTVVGDEIGRASRSQNMYDLGGYGRDYILF